MMSVSEIDGLYANVSPVIAGVHLSTPHHLIATATAVTTSSRAVAATVFTAIYATSFSNRAAKLVPQYIAGAALSAGLPPKVRISIGNLVAQRRGCHVESYMETEHPFCTHTRLCLRHLLTPLPIVFSQSQHSSEPSLATTRKRWQQYLVSVRL